MAAIYMALLFGHCRPSEKKKKGQHCARKLRFQDLNIGLLNRGTLLQNLICETIHRIKCLLSQSGAVAELLRVTRPMKSLKPSDRGSVQGANLP